MNVLAIRNEHAEKNDVNMFIFICALKCLRIILVEIKNERILTVYFSFTVFRSFFEMSPLVCCALSFGRRHFVFDVTTKPCVSHFFFLLIFWHTIVAIVFTIARFIYLATKKKCVNSCGNKIRILPHHKNE